jgi:hypothetical protein
MADWLAEDLDRCIHGRHSIDACLDCPNGKSTGNLFLLPEDDCPCYPAPAVAPIRIRIEDGRTEVRIGTMVRGEPIWVVAVDKPREGEQPWRST